MKKILKMMFVICIGLLLQIGTYNRVYAVSVIGTTNNNQIYAKSIKITNNKSTYYIGETFQFKTTISPDNATNKTVTWSSSDSSIASIDKNGKLTGKKKGTVTISQCRNFILSKWESKPIYLISGLNKIFLPNFVLSLSPKIKFITINSGSNKL